VALGYPLIDDGGWRKPAAAVGFPLPPEKKQPRPPATRQPAQQKRDSCTMFTQVRRTGFDTSIDLRVAGLL
jgi:hypothetical protein